MKFPDFSGFTIKEIKEFTAQLELNQELLDLAELLEQDQRKGVKKIASQLRNKLAEKQAVKDKWEKMAELERRMYEQGYQAVIGIDEAGRGPLAGPVVAAAVLLNPAEAIYGLDDSKKLSQKRREELLEELFKYAKVGIGTASSREIDKYNIREATFAAMKRAVKDLLPQLEVKPDLLLVDGNAEIPGLRIEQKTIIDGDAKINAVAAASIAAKVHRDNIIFEFAEKYPQYNFKANKGYGTAEHIAALEKYGASPIHRRSFGRVPERS
ncbi:MAG: ribonuclease HII [Halanaerobium sp.]